MTRARPSMTPVETGQPTSAPAGTPSRPACPGDHLAVRGEHPRRCERSVRPERILAPADQLLVDLLRPQDLVELLQREEEDVFLRSENAGLHEALGLFQ